MGCHYHCDACGEHVGIGGKWYLYYMFPQGANVQKYDFCRDCMKKVTKFMESLRGKK